MFPDVIWGQNNRVDIKDLQELVSWIDTFTNQAKGTGMPFSVQLQKDESSGLLFTVGSSICHLEFYSAHGSPIVIGCRGYWENGDEIITFWHGDEPSEMEKKYFIPFEDALQGIKEYFLTGERPKNIQWGDNDI